METLLEKLSDMPFKNVINLSLCKCITVKCKHKQLLVILIILPLFKKKPVKSVLYF